MYFVAPGSLAEELTHVLREKGVGEWKAFWPHVSTEDWPGGGGWKDWSLVVWRSEEEEEEEEEEEGRGREEL